MSSAAQAARAVLCCACCAVLCCAVLCCAALCCALRSFRAQRLHALSWRTRLSAAVASSHCRSAWPVLHAHAHAHTRACTHTHTHTPQALPFHSHPSPALPCLALPSPALPCWMRTLTREAHPAVAAETRSARTPRGRSAPLPRGAIVHSRARTRAGLAGGCKRATCRTYGMHAYCRTGVPTAALNRQHASGDGLCSAAQGSKGPCRA